MIQEIEPEIIGTFQANKPRSVSEPVEEVNPEIKKLETEIPPKQLDKVEKVMQKTKKEQDVEMSKILKEMQDPIKRK